MKKFPLFLCLVIALTASTQKASAQYYYYNNQYYDNPVVFGIGGSIGVMNCLSDVGGKKGVGKKFIKDLNIGNTQFAAGVFADVSYKNAVTVRIEGTFGQVKAYDSILKSVKASTFGRYERNLSFRSKVTEIAAIVELHPMYIFINWEGREDEPPRLSPYLLGGVGFFSFNPQAQRNGNWIDLQPLSTEGQGFAEYPNRHVYKLQQVSFPVGIGARYELSPLFNVRAECIYRITGTDYLDDVSTNFIDPNLYSNYFTGSRLTNALLLNDRHYELDPTYITLPDDQRGNPGNNDGYFTFNVKFSLTFGRERIRKH